MIVEAKQGDKCGINMVPIFQRSLAALMPSDSASTDWAHLEITGSRAPGLHRYDSHPDGAHSLGENIDIVQVMTQH